MLGAHVAILQRADLALGLAEIEEELLLRRGRAQLDHAPGAQDVFLDRRADPPHRIGREPEPLVRIEALHRLHQPDIRLGNHLGGRQAVAAIAHRDLCREPQMRGHQTMRRLGVAAFDPGLGEHEFLVRLQHGKFPDLREIPAHSLLRRRGRKICVAVRHGRYSLVASGAARTISRLPRILLNVSRARSVAICRSPPRYRPGAGCRSRAGRR